MDIELTKQRVCEEVDRLEAELLNVSHRIHAEPELCYKERFAHDLLAQVISDHGMIVERHAYGLDTAFEARSDGGSSSPNVAVICEYDALPGIGHGCGHNIIAASGLGAGLAAAAVAAEAGGRVTILGTPAEEGGGGKVLMLQRGAFADIDAAMMIHPYNCEMGTPRAIAVQEMTARYRGRAAHAASEPDQGLNALDAAVLGYNAVAALRQHIRDDERVHGVLTDGGDKPNIVPATAASEWYVRSPDLEKLELLKERVERCLKAGADAAGCTVETAWPNPAYAELAVNSALLSSYSNNLKAVGRTLVEADEDRKIISTDMGNVSHAVPSIHPMMRVAPSDVSLHTPAFADHARSEAGDAAVLDGAKAMAMTVVDCWLDGVVLDSARAEFDARCG